VKRGVSWRQAKAQIGAVAPKEKNIAWVTDILAIAI
jgi:hypothetical protein